MKKITSVILLSLLILCSLTSCNGKKADEALANAYTELEQAFNITQEISETLLYGWHMTDNITKDFSFDKFIDESEFDEETVKDAMLYTLYGEYEYKSYKDDTETDEATMAFNLMVLHSLLSDSDVFQENYGSFLVNAHKVNGDYDKAVKHLSEAKKYIDTLEKLSPKHESLDDINECYKTAKDMLDFCFGDNTSVMGKDLPENALEEVSGICLDGLLRHSLGYSDTYDNYSNKIADFNKILSGNISNHLSERNSK